MTDKTKPKRKLKSLKVDLVNATADQICEQLIRVSPGKAAAVGAKLVAHLGPAAVDATMERLDEAVDQISTNPGAVGRRLLQAFLNTDDE